MLQCCSRMFMDVSLPLEGEEMKWQGKKTSATLTVPRRRRASGSTRKGRSNAKEARLSRLHKPEEMSLEEWQRELRRQFGREQHFQLKNLGEQPIFSEFAVTNPQSGNSYQV